ncbi:unnamed protein product, partial [Ixodes hexagonus]
RRRSLRPSGGPSMTQSSDHIWDLLSTSPVRARNLEQDMEALRQSRHDNPYLQQQMERFSIQDDQADERQLLFPDEDQDYQDLHKHLIRSPPPQFPQDVAQFVFPSSPPPEEESMVDSQLLGRSAPFAIRDGSQELVQQARAQDMSSEDVYRSVLPRTAATR